MDAMILEDAAGELLGFHAGNCRGCEDSEGRKHGLYNPSPEAIAFVAAWLDLKRARSRGSSRLHPALRRMHEVLAIAANADGVVS